LEKKCTPRQNPGYAYVHFTKKNGKKILPPKVKTMLEWIINISLHVCVVHERVLRISFAALLRQPTSTANSLICNVNTSAKWHSLMSFRQTIPRIQQYIVVFSQCSCDRGIIIIDKLMKWAVQVETYLISCNLGSHACWRPPSYSGFQSDIPFSQCWTLSIKNNVK